MTAFVLQGHIFAKIHIHKKLIITNSLLYSI